MFAVNPNPNTPSSLETWLLLPVLFITSLQFQIKKQVNKTLTHKYHSISRSLKHSHTRALTLALTLEQETNSTLVYWCGDVEISCFLKTLKQTTCRRSPALQLILAVWLNQKRDVDWRQFPDSTRQHAPDHRYKPKRYRKYKCTHIYK